MTELATTRAKEQRRQVRSGCSSVLGCGFLVALAVLLRLGILLLLRKSVSPPGDDVVVFAYPPVIANEMFFSVLIVPIVLIFAIGVMKSQRLAVIGMVVALIAICAAGWAAWYRPYAAIAFHGDSLELRYLWPRPNLQIQKNDVIATSWSHSSRTTIGSPVDVYSLEIRTSAQRFVSFDDANFEDVNRVARRLKR